MRLSNPIALSLAAALGLSACSKGEAPAAPSSKDSELLVSSVKAALAEREKKVVSYRYDGVTEQAGQKVEFSFAYRAPQKMRADLKTTGVSFAFDGKRFVQYDANARTLAQVDMEKAPREKAVAVLHQVFSPFSPDGWRTPLLAGKLSAQKGKEGAEERITVSAVASDGSDTVTVNFLFVPPGMDFVSKSVVGGGAAKVTKSFCDAGTKLCFPEAIEESAPGGVPAVTMLSNIEVNAAIPPEFFDIQPGEGVKVEARTLE